MADEKHRRKPRHSSISLCFTIIVSVTPHATAMAQSKIQRPSPSPTLDHIVRHAQADYEANRRQHGAYAPQTLIAGFTLATHLAQRGRDAEAKPIYRALEEGFPRVIPPDAPEMARLLADMATVWERSGEASQALVYANRSSEIYRKHAESRDVQAISAPLLAARLHTEFGQLDKAQTSVDHARERWRGGQDWPPALGYAVQQADFDVAIAKGDLSSATRLLGEMKIAASADGVRLTDVSMAEVRLLLREGKWQQLQDLLGTMEVAANLRAGTQGDITSANISYYQGYVFLVRSQYVQAESVLRQALATYESHFSASHPVIARTLHSLALAYQELGSYDRAEAFYKRAIDILARNFGSDSANVIGTRLETTRLDIARRDYQKAERTAREGLRLLSAAQLPDQRLLAIAQTALGHSLQRQGRVAEALVHFAASLDHARVFRGAEGTELSVPLTHLAELYAESGRPEAALVALEQSIAIMRRDGMSAPTTEARALMIRARVAADAGQLDRALNDARASSELLQRRGELAGSDAQLGEAEQRIARPLYAEHALIAQRGSSQTPDRAPELIAESFAAAQGAALSSAARAVSQMSARFSKDAGELGDAVRRRQDLVQDRRAYERLATDLIGVAPHLRPPGQAEQIADALVKASQQIQALDDDIGRRFPGYRELVTPRPMALTRLQSVLDADEAVIFQLTLDKETLLWLVSNNDAELVRSDLGRAELDKLVRQVRETLVMRAGALRAFDTAGSAEIYRRTLGVLKTPLDRFRHLLFALDGPLQSLPPGLLLPDLPPPEQKTGYEKLPWLGVSHAISVVPTVGSLVLLREVDRPSQAPEPFAGFGNPMFGTQRGKERSMGALNLLRTGGPVDRSVFQRVPQLPETADELETMRRLLGGKSQHLYLASKATVRSVREAPLDQFRVLGFATHALTAGEFPGTAEPAILLTPGPEGDANDSGLLTASDIARLKLDADWVLLSACNTAAPDGTPSADGLSGLAQAFIFAGARTLLVSHWAVASEATVPLTTGTIARLAGNPALQKAEALRQVMQEMASGKVDPRYTHPAIWAPFIIVGDGWRGGAARN